MSPFPDIAGQRGQIVVEARRWIGTPYHHAADIRGIGVDCGMLLVRVFADAGLVAPFDPRPYPRDWHLHRDEERYLAFLSDRARAVNFAEPGDIVVFKHGRTYSHGGIVSVWPWIIHASWPARLVLEEDITGSPFATCPRRFFSYWGPA